MGTLPPVESAPRGPRAGRPALRLRESRQTTHVSGFAAAGHSRRGAGSCGPWRRGAWPSRLAVTAKFLDGQRSCSPRRPGSTAAVAGVRTAPQSVVTSSRQSFGSTVTMTSGRMRHALLAPRVSKAPSTRAPQPGRGGLKCAPAGGVRGPQAGSGGRVTTSREGQDADSGAGVGVQGWRARPRRSQSWGEGPGRDSQSHVGTRPTLWRPGVMLRQGPGPPLLRGRKNRGASASAFLAQRKHRRQGVCSSAL